MPRKKSNIFTKRSAQKVALTVKISAELKNRSDKIQEELAELSQELKFDVPVILVESLKDAVDSAESEIKRLRNQVSDRTTERVWVANCCFSCKNKQLTDLAPDNSLPYPI